MPVTTEHLKNQPMTEEALNEWRYAVSTAMLCPITGQVVISARTVLAINRAIENRPQARDIRVVISGMGGHWYPATPDNLARAEVWVEALSDGLGQGAVWIEER
jgi:hypothetical protein